MSGFAKHCRFLRFSFSWQLLLSSRLIPSFSLVLLEAVDVAGSVLMDGEEEEGSIEAEDSVDVEDLSLEEDSEMGGGGRSGGSSGERGKRRNNYNSPTIGHKE